MKSKFTSTTRNGLPTTIVATRVDTDDEVVTVSISLRALAQSIADALQRDAPPSSPRTEVSTAGGLLTAKALCSAMQVSPSTLGRACKAGCPSHAVGARRRFKLDEVRAWFADRGRVALPSASDQSSSASDPVDVSALASRAGFLVKDSRR
jgi:hypothetical protein